MYMCTALVQCLMTSSSLFEFVFLVTTVSELKDKYISNDWILYHGDTLEPKLVIYFDWFNTFFKIFHCFYLAYLYNHLPFWLKSVNKIHKSFFNYRSILLLKFSLGYLKCILTYRLDPGGDKTNLK